MDKLVKRLDAYYQGRDENLTANGVNCIYPLMETIPKARTRVSSDITEMPLVSLAPGQMPQIDMVSRYCRNLLAAFEKSKEDSFKVKSIDVKLNCATNPLKVNLENSTNRTYYVKCFDPIRLIGLELYNQLGPANMKYPFGFTQYDIVEPEIAGTHSFNLSNGELAKARASERFQYDRVLSDILFERIGLDDTIDNPKNYLITPNGRLAIIDFDCFTTESACRKTLERRKEITCSELGISRDIYDKIYKDELYNFNIRVDTERSKLESFLSAVRGDGPMTTENFITNMLIDNVRRKLLDAQ